MACLGHGQLIGSQYSQGGWVQLTGAAGAVALGVRQRVLAITCYATAAGATLQIGTNPAIALGTPPVGGRAGYNCDVGGGWPREGAALADRTVTFTGTANYVIELVDI